MGYSDELRDKFRTKILLFAVLEFLIFIPFIFNFFTGLINKIFLISYIAFLFAFNIFFVIFIIRYAKNIKIKRTEEIKEFALYNGFEYDEKGDIFYSYITGEILEDKKRVINAVRNAHPFFSNPNIEIENIISKNFNSKKIFFFDCSYSTAGEDSTTQSITICFIKLNNFYPHFSIKPRALNTKLFSILTGEIKMDGYENFNKNYILTGNNKDEILSFLTPDRIMSFEKNLGFYFEIYQNFLVIHKNKLISIKDYKQYTDDVVNMIKSINIE